MAVLDATERDRTFRQLMRNMPGNVAGLLKADLRAAVDATDTWIDNNAAAYNTALPAAARTNLTAAQKTFLFCYVAMRRAGLLRAEEDV
jgi:hypothetical protein